MNAVVCRDFARNVNGSLGSREFMSNLIKIVRASFAVAFLAILFTSVAWSQAQPWFFAVLSDPQMGMFAHDQNFAQETANFEFAVANLNRLHPRFVVICGDLVNRTGDAAQTDEYKRILKELDPSIAVYNVAGNHDVGNIPTAATLAAYRAAFGPDYYTFTAPGILGIVLDSNLIRSPEGAPEAAKLQNDWLNETLAAAKADRDRQIVVFQHIPYFIHHADEAENYFNIPQPARRQYLDLLEKAGVRTVFAGHYHQNATGTDGPLTEVVTGAVGKPLGPSVSGFRLVRVEGTTLEAMWYCLGKIPNTIDAAKPLPVTCPQ
jgi:3',5'-cyclic AMP phosphodiesterase CpdA